MAQRLATEYKRVRITLSKAQLKEFVRLFRLQKARIDEKVLENGDHEITLFDSNDEITLTFEKCGDLYLLHGHCTIKDRNLAELMRKAMTQFKGEAVMNRIFSSFQVEYQYDHGKVMSIREIHDNREKIIFKNTNFSLYLKKLLSSKEIEAEIEEIKSRVDSLLDQRNQAKIAGSPTTMEEIDQQLKVLSKRLFELEA